MRARKTSQSLKSQFDAPESLKNTRPDAPVPNSDDLPNKAQLEQIAEQKKASELIETQRKSIAMLKHVENKVNDLPHEEIITSLHQRGYYIKDNFLDDEDILSIMLNEATKIHTEKAKLQLAPSPDLGVASGEYSGQLKGGSDYADTPRCTEFVVSLTRHLCPNLNKVSIKSNSITLDETASMSKIHIFDRKAQRSALALLTGGDDDNIERSIDRSGSSRPYIFVTDGNEEDFRSITCYFYLTPKKWNDGCGGGIALKDISSSEENHIFSKNDRLILFDSHSTRFKELPWVGASNMEYGSYIVTHLVRKAS